MRQHITRRTGLALAGGAGLLYATSEVLGAPTPPVPLAQPSIEIEGAPSSIDSAAGTFVIEQPMEVDSDKPVEGGPFTVVTSESTSFEDRDDRTLTRAAFFSQLRGSDTVEVEGVLEDQAVTARKVELDDD